MNTPQIDTIGPAVAAMQARAAVCQAVDAGVVAMRAAGDAYLPQRPRESDKDWESRKDEADFFPAYKLALDSYVGKPLGSPVVPTDVPAVLEPLLENVDLQGRDLDSFCRPFFRAALRDGASWVVVDYPTVPAGLTMAQERALGARPYLVHVPLSNLVDFRGEVLADGSHRCTHFRYRETVDVPDGRWGVKSVERIRVLEPGTVEVWEKREANGRVEWFLVPRLSGPVSMTEVMVRCYIPSPEEWWSAVPVLEDLAHLNVTHWQSSSYQRSILNVARVPLLAADEDKRVDQTQPVEIGVKGMTVGFANIRYVEHTGAAIEAGERDIEKVEDRMRRVAGQALDQKVKTAKESTTDSRDASSKLRAWVWTFQDFLEETLRLMALWIGEKNGGGSVVLDMDWDEGEVGADLLTAWSAMREKGQISKETHLQLLKKAEVLGADVTVEEEAARLEAEGPRDFQVGT